MAKVKIKDLSDGSIYDMPEMPAILRAVRGEVKLLENPAYPIIATIQEAVDDLRSKVQPVPKEVLEQIEARKDPATWEAVKQALKPLIIHLFRDGRNYTTMDQIRREAEKVPFLRRFPNSIGQRVRDLVKEEFLKHYVQNGRIIVGHYILGAELEMKVK